MNKNSKILIIGAGPSGLTLAMELKRYGFKNVRVIEKNPNIVTRGRALGITPNTLEIMEESGLTDALLEKASKVSLVKLCKNGRINEFPLTNIHHKYKHLTTFEQEDIEIEMIQILEKNGGKVDRGVELFEIDERNNQARVLIDNKEEKIDYDLLIGADGVGSKTRELIRSDFEGMTEKIKWTQAEIEYEKPIEGAPVYLLLDDFPPVAVIPVTENVYRIVTPSKNILKKYTKISKLYVKNNIKQVLWESEFRVDYRKVKNMVKNNIVLIGDAAHVHSPVGGMGMNKGIADAYYLAKYLHEGKSLKKWESFRKKVDGGIVKRVRFASALIRQDGIIGKILATLLFYSSYLFEKLFVRNVLG